MQHYTTEMHGARARFLNCCSDSFCFISITTPKKARNGEKKKNNKPKKQPNKKQTTMVEKGR